MRSTPLRTRRPAGSSGRQSGQAIVYIVAMLPAIFLSILVVYNTAMATREKIRLQNTADATTYSANVLTARTLNYMAYTNRAMAANEASIATLASVQTTMGMVFTSGANIQEGRVVAEAYKGIRNLQRARTPVIGWIFLLSWLRNVIDAQRLHRTAERLAGLAEKSALPLQAATDVIRVLNQGISASQVAMLASTTLQLPQVVKEVMQANDPDANVPVGETVILVTKFVVDLGTYLETYHQSATGPFDQDEFDEVARFAHTAQAMRDDWTKKRRFLPNLVPDWSGWMKTGLAGAAQGMISNAPVPIPGIDEAGGDMLGGILEWKGGTELVAAENGITGLAGRERGRIRWQSADVVEVGLPLSLLYGETLPPSPDIARFRFGLGAGAAAAGGPNRRSSWEDKRVTLPTFATEARVYGDINETQGDEGNIIRNSFERAAEVEIIPRPLPLLPPMAVLVFDAKLHYGPLTQIGTGVTQKWSMPRYTDVKVHPPMVANESDNWLAQTGLSGANPLKWGKNTDKGPAFTLVVEKGGERVRTGQTASFGSPEANGRLGLLDNFAGKQVKALSTSQVYFRRPQDRWARRDFNKDDPSTAFGKFNFGFSGGYIEHRNLFSPYWHVHNVEPSLWARAVAMGGALAGSSDPDNGE